MDNHGPNPYPDTLIDRLPGGSGDSMNDQPRRSRPEVETLQRVKRIETRLTQTMIAMGIKTEGQRPIFAAGKLTVPSMHCSLKEILDTIPGEWQGPVAVFIGDDRVAVIGELGNSPS